MEKKSGGQFKLSKAQVEFVKNLTGINHPLQAVQKLAEIMVSEGADPGNMSYFIDRMMQKRKLHG